MKTSSIYLVISRIDGCDTLYEAYIIEAEAITRAHAIAKREARRRKITPYEPDFDFPHILLYLMFGPDGESVVEVQSVSIS